MTVRSRPISFALAAAVALTCLAATGGSAFEPGLQAEPTELEALLVAIEAVLEETGVPGVGLALVGGDGVDGDRFEWTGGVGVEDRATGTPVGPGTLFRMGSVSKSFVSLAVLQLVEEGAIGLDDPVRSLIPEVELENPWEESEPVRVVHLLEHTAGFDDMHLPEYALRDPEITLREGLAFHPDSRVTRWPPGLHFSYSNSGPAVAAYLVESLADRTFEEHVRERIFLPLGMQTAGFRLTPSVEAGLATGYAADGLTERPYAHISLRPSGALNASPQDMAAFVRMLLDRGRTGEGQLVSPESIERMETPGSPLSARHAIRAGYALGNMATPRRGFLWRGHAGGIDGFIAEYGYLVDENVGYAIAMNAENGAAFARVNELVKDHLTRELTPPEPELAAPSAEGVANLEPYAGFYVSVAPRLEITRFVDRILGVVRVEAGGSTLRTTPVLGDQGALLPLGNGRFRAEEDPIATVAFMDVEGEGRILQAYSSVLQGSYERVSPLSVRVRWTLSLASLLMMASSLAFAVVWVPRRLLGGLRDRNLGVRAWPALAVLCLAGAAVLLTLGGADPMYLGTPTIYSVGFSALTLLFAGAALAGAVSLVRTRRDGMKQGAWWHALLVTGANLLVAVYLGSHGILGLRFWSY